MSGAAPVAAPVGPGAVVPGIDVVEVAQVARALDRFGERYLRRVFAPDEVAAADALAPARRTAWLAGRLAAKEAVYKALRMPAEVGLAWRSIRVLPGDDGQPEVHLDGPPGQWARRGGITGVRVSVSQAGGTAVAMAVAEHGGPFDAPPQGGPFGPPPQGGPFGHEVNAAPIPAAEAQDVGGADDDGTIPHTTRFPRSTP